MEENRNFGWKLSSFSSEVLQVDFNSYFQWSIFQFFFGRNETIFRKKNFFLIFFCKIWLNLSSKTQSVKSKVRTAFFMNSCRECKQHMLDFENNSTLQQWFCFIATVLDGKYFITFTMCDSTEKCANSTCILSMIFWKNRLNFFINYSHRKSSFHHQFVHSDSVQSISLEL